MCKIKSYYEEEIDRMFLEKELEELRLNHEAFEIEFEKLLTQEYEGTNTNTIGA